MPALAGPGFSQVLRHHPPSLCQRVMFLTGDTLDPDIQAFLDHTVLPCLHKLFTAAMVRQAIRAFQEEYTPVNVRLSTLEALSKGENDV